VREGLELVDRNVRCGGVELDIVARFGGGARGRRGAELPPATYAFIEVRSRAHARLGAPELTIDGDKRARLRRGATAWLVHARLLGRVAVRFDVIAVVVHRDARASGDQPAPPRMPWRWTLPRGEQRPHGRARGPAQLELLFARPRPSPALASSGVLERDEPPTNDAPGATLRWYLGAFES
jgi:Holliday junction resolvase-like predicted endonuclease